jgi:hypothetical protein
MYIIYRTLVLFKCRIFCAKKIQTAFPAKEGIVMLVNIFTTLLLMATAPFITLIYGKQTCFSAD